MNIVENINQYSSDFLKGEVSRDKEATEFMKLSEELQTRIYCYLAEIGVKTDVIKAIAQLAFNKEEELYQKWFETFNYILE